jgi:hypothetical protein
MFVAPVLLTADPARMAKLAAPASAMGAWVVVCVGITTGFGVDDEPVLFVSFLHPATKARESAANAIIFFDFIF